MLNDLDELSRPFPAGQVVIVSAPSGAGKTSLSQALVQRLSDRGERVRISVSYTTRQRREGEVDGVHYHFIDELRFARMVAENQFLEHAEVFGHHYGTGRAETARLVDEGYVLLLDIDWQGRQQLRHSLPQAVSVFVLPPSAAELERRLRGRGQDAEAVIQRRLGEARAEMAHLDEYDYLIVNDRFERALDDLTTIVCADRLRSSTQQHRHAALLRTLLDPGLRIR